MYYAQNGQACIFASSGKKKSNTGYGQLMLWILSSTDKFEIKSLHRLAPSYKIEILLGISPKNIILQAEVLYLL
jgi:hypothetical protein